MSKPTKSKISFIGYKVRNSNFVLINDEQADEYECDINPSGIINKTDNSFLLRLQVKVFGIFEGEKSFDYDVDIVGIFGFDELSELTRALITKNSIAILFPHLRAYISMTSALTGGETIMIPPFDVRTLSELLKKNLEEIGDAQVNTLEENQST